MHECNENCQDPCPYEGWEDYQVPGYWETEWERLRDIELTWPTYLAEE